MPLEETQFDIIFGVKMNLIKTEQGIPVDLPLECQRDCLEFLLHGEIKNHTYYPYANYATHYGQITLDRQESILCGEHLNITYHVHVEATRPKTRIIQAHHPMRQFLYHSFSYYMPYSIIDNGRDLFNVTVKLESDNVYFSRSNRIGVGYPSEFQGLYFYPSGPNSHIIICVDNTCNSYEYNFPVRLYDAIEIILIISVAGLFLLTTILLSHYFSPRRVSQSHRLR